MRMEEENELLLLQKYRRDRHVLLDFILSGSLLAKVVMPPGAVTLDDLNLDQVSVDHVLNCAKKGLPLDLAEAIREYHGTSALPNMISNGSADEYYLATNPVSSGPPPRRPPPLVPPLAILPAMSPSDISDDPFSEDRELTVDDIEDFEDEDNEGTAAIRMSRRNAIDVSDLIPKLPAFASGINDDDLGESAYEVLLACAGASGGLIVPSKEKKKEKKSSLMKKLGRSKSGSIVQQKASGIVGLLEIMRAQMEISEEMDARTRQGLLNALAGKAGKRMDTLLVPLELLYSISRTEFSDKKAYLRWQKRQLYMLEEGLINHPVVGFGESGGKASELRVLLTKIEESEFQPSSAGDVQRMESLKSLREIAVSMAERPTRDDLTGEVCHWADGYPLNVKLYEKLLLGVFDITYDGKLAEESEEILSLLKSTWRVLGITETIHYTCYSSVLFRQLILTEEPELLQHTFEQLSKIPLKEQRGPKERLLLKSLLATYEEKEISFVTSFLLPIKMWTSKQLGDYHLNFTEVPKTMSGVVNIFIATWRLLIEETDQAPLALPSSQKDAIDLFITSSMNNVFARTLQNVEMSDKTHEHPLALLCEATKELIKKESTIFSPILLQYHPQAVVSSVSLLHKVYGKKLKPFLDSSEQINEDVVSVLPAAESLESYALEVISKSQKENGEANFQKLASFNVEQKSGDLVARWLNAQLERITGWVERAAQRENWSPISPQQRHGSSVVDVYTIVEETVDKFFSLNVPMRPSELTLFARGIDNSFQKYSHLVVDKLVTTEELIPPTPVLTRFKKESSLKMFVKKELFDSKQQDEPTQRQFDAETTASFCVRLNTLYYAVSHFNKVEDLIWDKWSSIKTHEHPLRKSGTVNSNFSKQKCSLEGSRKAFNAAIDRLCELVGTKVLFWDLREQLIENLYKQSVSQARIDVLIGPLDNELNQLCALTVDPLRDRVATSLLQATLEGFLRVILDGGSSRFFSASDARLLSEDLEALKEFFISGGDGLPRGIVENHLARPRFVIKLHSYETRELIEEIKSSSIAGNGGKLGADTNTLLRILCHRPDSEASQFVKKQFKIPKALS